MNECNFYFENIIINQEFVIFIEDDNYIQYILLVYIETTMYVILLKFSLYNSNFLHDFSWFLSVLSIYDNNMGNNEIENKNKKLNLLNRNIFNQLNIL